MFDNAIDAKFDELTATTPPNRPWRAILALITAIRNTFEEAGVAHGKYLDYVTEFERRQIERGSDVWRFGRF